MRTTAVLDAAADRLERADALDVPAGVVRKVVDTALSPPGVRAALTGGWLGHPVHPVLVVAPLGGWLSATVLDLRPGNRRAARTLVGLGTLAAVPTALTGWADWSRLPPRQQRVGLVHAAGNGVAVALQAASWRARRRGAQGRGVALSLAALGAGGVAGWLGGYLAHGRAAVEGLPEWGSGGGGESGGGC